MKNIFIEGIQGMGKSTLLNAILNKQPAYHACHEGDYSPVELAWCAWMTAEEYKHILLRYAPIKEGIKKGTVREGIHYVVSYTKILTDISGFHKELEKFEIYNGRKSLADFEHIVCSRHWKFSQTGYLFECAFFQNIMEELILYQLLSDDEILTFYRKLYQGINKEDFLLLYLYSSQVEESTAVIKKERCDSLGNEMWYPLMLEYLTHSPYGQMHGYCSLEDMVAHFRHRQQLELRIIHEVIGRQAVILPAKDWEIEEIIRLIA